MILEKFRYVLLSICIALNIYVNGQSVGIGEFYDHLPYNNGSSLCISNEKIYVASGQALFTYDLANNSIETHTFVCLDRAGCFGQH